MRADLLLTFNHMLPNIKGTVCLRIGIFKITCLESFLPKSISKTLDCAPSTKIVFPSLIAFERYGIVSFTNGLTLFLKTCKITGK